MLLSGTPHKRMLAVTEVLTTTTNTANGLESLTGLESLCGTSSRGQAPRPVRPASEVRQSCLAAFLGPFSDFWQVFGPFVDQILTKKQACKPRKALLIRDFQYFYCIYEQAQAQALRPGFIGAIPSYGTNEPNIQTQHLPSVKRSHKTERPPKTRLTRQPARPV